MATKAAKLGVVVGACNSFLLQAIGALGTALIPSEIAARHGASEDVQNEILYGASAWVMLLLLCRACGTSDTRLAPMPAGFFSAVKYALPHPGRAIRIAFFSSGEREELLEAGEGEEEEEEEEEEPIGGMLEDVVSEVTGSDIVGEAAAVVAARRERGRPAP